MAILAATFCFGPSGARQGPLGLGSLAAQQQAQQPPRRPQTEPSSTEKPGPEKAVPEKAVPEKAVPEKAVPEKPNSGKPDASRPGSNAAEKNVADKKLAERDRDPPERRPVGHPTAADRLPAFSAAREAAALSFVKEHHSELTGLLSSLKVADRAEYQKAIRDLFRTSERLAQIRERDEERYEWELSAWQVASRVRVLAARLTMEPESEDLLNELRAALREQIDIRIARDELEMRRAQARADKLRESLARLRETRDQNVERALSQLLQAMRGTSARTDRQPDRQPASEPVSSAGRGASGSLKSSGASKSSGSSKTSD